MRLSNFKQFNESSDSNILSQDEVKDIFIDLLDEGYIIKFHSQSADYSFFELEKSLTDDLMGALDKNNTYGYTNISNIVSEYNKLLLLDGIKRMLNSMGYLIAFEFESNLTTTSDRSIKIICHLEYDVDWLPPVGLSDEDIDDLDDEEYEEYMRGQ